jgi:hypothetical protein
MVVAKMFNSPPADNGSCRTTPVLVMVTDPGCPGASNAVMVKIAPVTG